MKQIWIMTRLTLREATRRRIVLTTLIVGLAFLVVYTFGFYIITAQTSAIGRGPANAVIEAEGTNFLALAGLYTVTFLSIAMAALLSADTLAGEISTGTVQSLVSKPVRRANVVLGKWLGFALMLGAYLLVMGGGVVVSVWVQSGYTIPNLLAGLALIYLESLLIMSVALMCSSRLSALATGAVVFGLYGLAFIGGWVEQFGSFMQNQTAVYIGVISSLILPSEALWRRAAFEMQTPFSGLIGMSPFGAISVPSPLMIVYAVVYMAVAILVTLRVFARRDL